MAATIFPYGRKTETLRNGRLFLADGAWFGAVALLALATGTVADQLFRNPPVGLTYRPAALRPGLSSASETPIMLDEMRALVGQPGVVLLDARPNLFFEMSHLPGAHLLSREQFAEGFARIEPLLRAAGQTLVVYCSDAECEDGGRVAQSLRERGLENVRVFVGGIAEWEAAGLPMEVGK